jgi:hypothetical protein
VPRGIPNHRTPSTAPALCLDCGAPVAVFGYGRRGGFLSSARCARCRQRHSAKGYREYVDRMKVEKVITAKAGKATAR